MNLYAAQWRKSLNKLNYQIERGLFELMPCAAAFLRLSNPIFRVDKLFFRYDAI